MLPDNPQQQSWPPPPDTPVAAQARSNRWTWMRGWMGLLVSGLLGAAGGAIIGILAVPGIALHGITQNAASGWIGATMLGIIVGAILGFPCGLAFWCVFRAIEGIVRWSARRGSRTQRSQP